MALNRGRGMDVETCSRRPGAHRKPQPGHPLSSATAAGRPAAWMGTMVWGIAAAVGVSALLAASELAYCALTLAGAAYMIRIIDRITGTVLVGFGLRDALEPRQ